MHKKVWIDTETTGDRPHQSAVIQIGGIIEIEGDICSTINIRLAPHEGAHINEKALVHNGTTQEEIELYPPMEKGFIEFKDFLKEFVNPYDPNDKFVMCGYNVKFDSDMLRGLFTRNEDTFFGSWFFWPTIDVQTYVAEAILHKNLRLPNYQLGTICKHYGIEIDAHDAMSDINATRNLYYLLRG